MKKKSIIIDEFHHKELVKISNVFGAKYGDFAESMILYFKKTGINPLETTNDNPATMIKVLDKRIVSFLKVQERDILKPLRNEIFEYSSEQKKQYESLSKWIQESIIKVNHFDKERTQKINQELKNVFQKIEHIEKKIEKQQEAFYTICELIDQKNKSGLKGKLNSIFNNAN
ncbi:BfmA/BtgA family mobilization protein [Tenacibaculum mesophilum]|uniref:BfmA/BtgA family mobilization protein n=1 Tax=Tenacibaculum mesophilum TaxID=104268 RepID=UPI000649E30F|nr:BfmA/BtgA family mobilization protein [Tenacibaculum mesophilum]